MLADTPRCLAGFDETEIRQMVSLGDYIGQARILALGVIRTPFSPTRCMTSET
jgi:hypothetical protein